MLHHALILLSLMTEAGPSDARKCTVGMTARIDQLLLPGPELEVRPLDDRRVPLVIRIVGSYAHGDSFRYDIEYYGLDPGTFDLKDYLRRRDGSDASNLPAIPVTIASVLPPGQVVPNELRFAHEPGWLKYRALLWTAGILWVVGLLVILLAGRRRQKDATTATPVTLADHLRPLVTRATAGELSPTELADLERTLMAYWRRRLGWEHFTPSEASTFLRTNSQAGPLLQQLEIWLHRPAANQPVDVVALLRPYQDIPSEEFAEVLA